MRILLVAPPRSFITDSLSLLLTAAGHVVYDCDDGGDGIDIARRYAFDLLVVLCPLPDEPAFVRRLRGAGVAMPVIAISSTDNPAERIALLDDGADDCVASPYRGDELLARALAVLRRSRGLAMSIARFGDLAIDLGRRTASIADAPLRLTGKEYAVLEALALRRDQVVTKGSLLDQVYGGRDEPDPKIIDVYICKIRAKMRALGLGLDYIETIWGRGYMLREPAPSPALPWRQQQAFLPSPEPATAVH